MQAESTCRKPVERRMTEAEHFLTPSLSFLRILCVRADCHLLRLGCDALLPHVLWVEIS